MERPGSHIHSGTSHRIQASHLGFTRPTSRVSNGTCGSRRWETGAVSLRVVDRRATASERLGRTGAVCAQSIPGTPPKEVRCVVYQYWFTSEQTRRERGLWWRREMLGEYAPTLEREPDGKIVILDFPGGEAPTP